VIGFPAALMNEEQRQVMEKYGVVDLAEQQRVELAEVQKKIVDLRNLHEKTAAQVVSLEQLEAREAELKDALGQ
jgi:uncharacterized protein YydD (DUF2326 family)